MLVIRFLHKFVEPTQRQMFFCKVTNTKYKFFISTFHLNVILL